MTQQDPPWPEMGFTPNMMEYVGDLYDYQKGQRVVDGPGLTWTDAPGGGKMPHVDLEAVAAAATPIPFDVTIVDATTIRIRRGTINSVQPTGMFPGDDPPLTMTLVNSRYVLVELTLSHNTSTNVWSITGAAIILASSVTAATSSTAYFEIGSIGTAGQVTSARVGTLAFERCGNATTYADTWFGTGS